MVHDSSRSLLSQIFRHKGRKKKRTGEYKRSGRKRGAWWMEEAMGISSNNDEEDDTATQVVKVTKN